MNGDLDPKAKLDTQLKAMASEADAFALWWSAPDGGRRLLEGLLAARRNKHFKGWQDRYVTGAHAKVARWLEQGPFESELKIKEYERLTPTMLAQWSGQGAVEDQAFYELATRLAGFLENRDKMLRETRPPSSRIEASEVSAI